MYVAHRPHRSLAAGVLKAAAGCYELTPLKRMCRRRCRERVRSGFEFGVPFPRLERRAALMLLVVALGVMSIDLMVVVAIIVLVHKVLPPSPWAGRAGGAGDRCARDRDPGLAGLGPGNRSHDVKRV